MAEGRRKGAERRESDSDSAPRRSAKRRPSRLPRLVYWSLVLGLWLVIAAAGTMVWVAINLPPIHVTSMGRFRRQPKRKLREVLALIAPLQRELGYSTAET